MPLCLPSTAPRGYTSTTPMPRATTCAWLCSQTPHSHTLPLRTMPTPARPRSWHSTAAHRLHPRPSPPHRRPLPARRLHRPHPPPRLPRSRLRPHHRHRAHLRPTRRLRRLHPRRLRARHLHRPHPPPRPPRSRRPPSRRHRAHRHRRLRRLTLSHRPPLRQRSARHRRRLRRPSLRWRLRSSSGSRLVSTVTLYRISSVLSSAQWHSAPLLFVRQINDDLMNSLDFFYSATTSMYHFSGCSPVVAL